MRLYEFDEYAFIRQQVYVKDDAIYVKNTNAFLGMIAKTEGGYGAYLAAPAVSPLYETWDEALNWALNRLGVELWTE